jgi:hypothetical protein
MDLPVDNFHWFLSIARVPHVSSHGFFVSRRQFFTSARDPLEERALELAIVLFITYEVMGQDIGKLVNKADSVLTTT